VDKNFVIAGIISCLWLKSVEFYLWNTVNPALLTPLVATLFKGFALAFFFGLLVSLMLEDKNNKIILSGLIPVLFFFFKDFLNALAGLQSFQSLIFNTLPESLLIAFPIGVASYWIINEV